MNATRSHLLHRAFASLLLLATLCFTLWPRQISAAAAEPLYQNDLENEDVGFEPLDFLILDGKFAVKQEPGNRVLELPGSPLQGYGLLFGPTETDGLEVRARILASRKKRLFPTFGVGVNGASGYKLLCSPGRGAIELKMGDEVKAAAPLKWNSDTWTHFRLQIVKTGASRWKICGKLWEQGSKEPEKWQVQIDETKEPPAGRPAIWGTPYSDQPIQYDDLKVLKAKAE